MISRHAAAPLAHRAVIHGDTIYLAGMVADDKSLPVEGQTRQALEKIDALLKSLGSDATRILATTNYLIDITHKEGLNAAWTAFFAPEHMPTRATMAVAQLGPGTLVEIVATAAVGPAEARPVTAR